jgi:hypothetical protein
MRSKIRSPGFRMAGHDFPFGVGELAFELRSVTLGRCQHRGNGEARPVKM